MALLKLWQRIFLQYSRSVTLISSRLSQAVMPKFYAFLLFTAGMTLLWSAVTPTIPGYVARIKGSLLPLSLMEISYLTAALSGILCLFVSRGIFMRLNNAWYFGVILLIAAVLTSSFKGTSIVETLFYVTVLLLFLPSYEYFNREASLITISLPFLWRLGIVGGVFLMMALGFYVHRHRDLVHGSFEFSQDPARFIRFIGLSIFSLVIIFTARALKVKPYIKIDKIDESKAVLPLVVQSLFQNSWLTLCGDKSIFWSPNRDAFLMYDCTQKFWISMGDPIGNEASFESLLWSFKLEAYKYGCRVAFYEVSDHYLSKYLDMGLILLKMGEEAHIDLTHFTPSGRKKEVVRNARNRIQKMRYQFSVLYPPYDHHVMQRLKNVSDRWLKSMKTGEKAFSMGFFNPDYLKHTPIAVMYDPQGDIVAFANLWIVNEGRKIGIDLMRYESNTPRGMMDALLLETILWAQSEHFEFFSLGMAPLSGLEDHPLAPLWHKMGRLVFDHGNKIYNFEGLHRYKSKFDPIWKPRYVAAPMGLNLPFLFRDIIRLISGVKR